MSKVKEGEDGLSEREQVRESIEHVTIARGPTFEFKEVLKKAGFKWCATLQIWRHDPPLSENEIKTLSRSIASVDVEIRNVRKKWL